MKEDVQISEVCSYPKKKVIIGFLICPSLVSIFFSLYFLIILVVKLIGGGGGYFLRDIYGFVVFFVISILVGQVYFLIPALLLGVVVSFARFYKKISHLIVSSIGGGLLAGLWVFIFQYGDMQKWEGGGIFSPVLCFSYGALSSFLVGLFVFPLSATKRIL